MPIKILMPSLSPTMTEGKITNWLKKEGDKIKSGDVIAEIETDKATIEYEAVEEGILGKIIIPSGAENVLVNTLIGVILEEGEKPSDIDTFISSSLPTTATPANNNNTPIENTTSKTTTGIENKVNINTQNNKIFVSPLAKRIASQHNLDIYKIQGTGPSGRIIKKDIEAALTGSVTSPTNATNQNTIAFEDKQNSSMRKIIAKRLLESKTTVPHYYLNIDCNMANVNDARALLNKQAIDVYKLSVNDFIIKAVALAMKAVPEANAAWQGDTTRFFNTSDVAVAVATPTGLITPIVKQADTKGLLDISNEMKDLAKRAKDGKLKPDEYQGGGFSISNLGMFGIKDFCAIINPPQAGILAIGATEDRPIVKNGQIVIASIMSVTLSADHRIMDGAVGAKFLNEFKKYIENPVSMIL